MSQDFNLLPKKRPRHEAIIIVHIFRRGKKKSHLASYLEGEKWRFGRKKKYNTVREGKKKSTIGEKATMVLACFLKHVSESLPPANTGKFSKLLRR